ncbi:MAG: preprotein translocase subunit SecG [Brachymonas sp.]|nr:preprotein translocase subunit SecG [Brachymonas sp.]
MNILFNILLVVQVISALVMIGLILMQQGKGATAGATFGSGASGSLFGSSGSATFLSRTTAVLATVFFACTLVLAYYGNRGNAGGSSVLDRLPKAAPTATLPSTAASVAGAASAAASAASVPASGDAASMIPGTAPAASAQK